jgi:hypothetical protein
MMLAGLLLQATNLADPGARPWATFQSVCLDGAPVTSQKDLQPSTSQQLPPGARRALGRNLIDAGLLASVGVNFVVSASEDLRNPVYTLANDAGFLVLSTSENKKTNAFSGLCGMVVPGDHYLEVLSAVDAKAASKLSKKLAKSSQKGVEITEYRHRSSRGEITVTEVDGWTSVAINAN